MSERTHPTDQSPGMEKQLLAVLAADVVGFSRLMNSDARATVESLDAARAVFRAEIESRMGRVIDMAGDSVLSVFGSAPQAVDAAVAIQSAIRALAAAQSKERRMLFRIGVHRGELIAKADGTVYGDSVNIAARLEGLAPPGGIAVSLPVYEQAEGQVEVAFLDMGEHSVKNVGRPVHVFLLDDGGNLPIHGLSTNTVALAEVGNLPGQSTSLVGRAHAVAEIVSLLGSHRLITLLGMGGLGKTRLSIASASQASRHFPDGAWFVDLAAVSEGSTVGPAAAGVFGVAQQAGKTIEESLIDALGARRLLLVLDNCEHVIPAAASLAGAILAGCPRIRVLATSREALGIEGEHLWAVPPLEFSGETAPAVELFVERGRAVLPTFTLGNHGEVIGAICRELDGIPLAIELAAARVRSLSPAQILERLTKRFRLLTRGDTERDRHRTLRNAVQWSFDYLTPEEQAVVTRAAVFAGGFSLEAAEQVCSDDQLDSYDVCDLLDSVVSKSLVQADRVDGAVRFSMLETIRHFGTEKLVESGEIDAVRARHARFFAGESSRYFEVWRSPRERDANLWLDLEINNLRAAFRWALDHDDVDSAAQIASDVGDMGRFRLREEAANWAEEVIERARVAKHRRLTVLLTWCASSAWAFQRFDDAKRFGEEAIAQLDDPAYDPFVWAYGDLAFVSIFSGDIPRAIELLRIGSEHPADDVDRFIRAFHLFIMATAGYADQAAAIADDVVAQVEERGVPMAVAVAHGAKGAAIEGKDPAAALESYERGIAAARSSGSRFMETLIAPRVAALHARSGEPLEALRGFERMLTSFGEATDIASVSAWRASLVVLFGKLGLQEAAATLHGTFADAIDVSGVVPEHGGAIARVREELGASAFATAAARGAAMSLREASTYAIEQVQRGLSSLTAS